MSMFVLGSVSLLYTAYKDNKSLDRSLTATRHRADSLYLLNDSSLQRVQLLEAKLDSSSAGADKLKKSISVGQMILQAKNKELAWSKQAADSANRKIESLLALRKKDEGELKELQAKRVELEKGKKELEGRIIAITESNDKLSDVLFNVKDNVWLETYSRNGKLNVKGKRVRKIAATLSVPFELKHPTGKFFDPTGKPIPDPGGSFDFHSVNDVNSTFAGGYQSTKIELSYSPSNQLGKGTYKIEVLDGSRHIGNLMVSFK
jgi:hypothetical protein